MDQDGFLVNGMLTGSRKFFYVLCVQKIKNFKIA